MTLAAALLALLIGQGRDPGTPPPAQPPAPVQPPGGAPQPAAAREPAATPPAAGEKVAPKTRIPTPRSAPVASLPSVEGEVAAIDHRAHSLRLRVEGTELVLSFDRNTLVSGPAGAVTPLAIASGAKIRVGRDGDARAAWIELRPTSPAPRAAP